MLDLLDKELEKRGHTFARYADDFIILVGSKRAGERVLRSVTSFVGCKLKLKVNDTKSKVAPVNQSKFLGFTFHGGSLKWLESAVEKFKFQIRQLTGRSNGTSMEKRIAELTVCLRGWINFFALGKAIKNVSTWIIAFLICLLMGRRLRMCYWPNCWEQLGSSEAGRRLAHTTWASHMWRRPRTKVRNLLKLGVPLDMAIACGISSKSYWRSAKTEGIHRALSNEFFAEKGLLSLRDRWVEIHYG